jgi:hypothetical protein
MNTMKKSLFALTVLSVGALGVSQVDRASAHDSEGERGGRFQAKAFLEDIERSVVNIEDGVVLTITSDDEEAIAALHERANREPGEVPQAEKFEKRPEIDHDVKILDNGVEITITSEDPEVVTQLQEHEGRPFGRKGPMPKN